jgi:hypothetical protein
MANRRGDWLQRLHCTLDRRRFDILVPAGERGMIIVLPAAGLPSISLISRDSSRVSAFAVERVTLNTASTVVSRLIFPSCTFWERMCSLQMKLETVALYRSVFTTI